MCLNTWSREEGQVRFGERGATVKAGYDLPVRDKRTRAERYETLDADFSYTPEQIDRTVLVPNQIRTVLETFRDSLFTELFRGPPRCRRR
jgi:type I restriction enzyme, R subunit